jgi:hypothetical protein
MMSPVISLLAAAGSLEEHSKTPFYIAGAVLVAFALAVSFVGIRSAETFPGSVGARRGLSLVTIVLVAAAMATAVITA